MGLTLAKAYVVVKADSSQLSADFRKAEAKTKSHMTKLSSISRSAMTAIGLSVTAVTLTLLKAGKFAASFEQEMVNVRANARLLGEEGEVAFQKILKVVRQVAATTRYTAGETAKAMNQLVLAGLNAEQAIGALPNVINLASSGNLELAAASKVLVDNMVKYNLTAKDTARIGDVLSSAQSRAQVTARDLADSHLALGGIAAAMGAEFEDVTAILVGMGKAGTNMRLAGTAIGRALSRMAGKPKDTAEAMKELGVVMENFTKPGGGVDIIPLFRDIANRLPIDPIKRGAAVMKLFGERGRAVIGVLNLMRRGGFVEDVRKGFEEDIGRAATVTAAKFDTFIGKSLELVSALGELSITMFPIIQVFEGLIVGTRSVTNAISTATEGVWSFLSSIKELTAWLAADMFKRFKAGMDDVRNFLRELEEGGPLPGGAPKAGGTAKPALGHRFDNAYAQAAENLKRAIRPPTVPDAPTRARIAPLDLTKMTGFEDLDAEKAAGADPFKSLIPSTMDLDKALEDVSDPKRFQGMVEDLTAFKTRMDAINAEISKRKDFLKDMFGWDRVHAEKFREDIKKLQEAREKLQESPAGRKVGGIISLLEGFGGFGGLGDYLSDLDDTANRLSPNIEKLKENLQQLLSAELIDRDKFLLLLGDLKEAPEIVDGFTQRLRDLTLEVGLLRGGARGIDLEIGIFKAGAIAKHGKELGTAMAAAFAKEMKDRAGFLEEPQKKQGGFGRTGFGQYGQRIQDIINQSEPQRRMVDAAERGAKAGEEAKVVLEEIRDGAGVGGMGGPAMLGGGGFF